MEESSTVYCFANWKEREDGRGKEPDLPDFVEDYVCIWSNWDYPRPTNTNTNPLGRRADRKSVV